MITNVSLLLPPFYETQCIMYNFTQASVEYYLIHKLYT